jgi:hypothetical protein
MLTRPSTNDEVNSQSPQPPGREKNPFAVALGKLGASKGGKARAASLSRRERVKIARQAAAVRWKQT